jgi:hypothetical protein
MSTPDEKLNKFYIGALKAVAKGYRSSTGARKIPERDRGTVKYMARQAAKSPTYQILASGGKLNRRKKADLERLARFGKLKSYVKGEYERQGQRKLPPSAKEWLRTVAKGKADDYHLHASVKHNNPKRADLALVDGTWFVVDRYRKDPESYSDKPKPYFIGIGSGYDIHRYLIVADDESAAIEAAEYLWPRALFSDIKSPKRVKPDEEDEYTYIERLGKMGKREEDIRIFKRAREFVSNAVKIDPHGSDYRLPDGRIIEAH